MSKFTIKVTYTGKPIDQEQLARLVLESLLAASEKQAPSEPPEPTQREEHTIA